MKRYVAEGVGTAFVVLAVLGSAYLASNLTSDSAIQLLLNCLSTVIALYIAIRLCIELSGSHFNPIVSLISYTRKLLTLKDLSFYVLAQFIGALIGAAIANAMFSQQMISLSQVTRASNSTLIGEVIASCGLILIAFSQSPAFSTEQRAKLIALWIASAYFFTSSTAFANPAVSFGRVFTDSPAGIEIHSFVKFAIAQLAGGAIASIFVKPKGKLWRM